MQNFTSKLIFSVLEWYDVYILALEWEYVVRIFSISLLHLGQLVAGDVLYVRLHQRLSSRLRSSRLKTLFPNNSSTVEGAGEAKTNPAVFSHYNPG